MPPKDYPHTPDGRYFVSKGRLWRTTNPALPDDVRRAAIKRLMRARMDVRRAGDDAAMRDARARVQEAKEALGERGPVWWDDDAPDQTQTAPQNSTYADWWAALDPAERSKGTG
ncbi:hypothetical protein [Pseudosulfitobacter pseudonitzschiae]|uniref:hypothetical protein n=1 Tax=Pseudosulfitobacter pseudonitzschiae TaxID=1402135 RepID=UPI001AF09284|nr:hypothetical protein [Pseudosulfitobacter pseudonitzschiae]MBM1813558.1 hypothetical protein [Pseudosulfitobacter pseudonitzschiae]MBM1830551.1 hypothetical protein [Pseudosulfitobacter pseudonitzschiae]MBM1835418.1 hypothetical protein [Pseudosulfitobacter pseudonitzschiae]MBM1840264.1 hypothetical protein [Pseudosulfitobacter pseudonitzschiae]MBM1845748.1 hypothetical protein [Pseudosulfitobacter pseudonitzschiae]